LKTYDIMGGDKVVNSVGDGKASVERRGVGSVVGEAVNVVREDSWGRERGSGERGVGCSGNPLGKCRPCIIWALSQPVGVTCKTRGKERSICVVERSRTSGGNGRETMRTREVRRGGDKGRGREEGEEVVRGRGGWGQDALAAR
jgi:hypothetical protein